MSATCGFPKMFWLDWRSGAGGFELPENLRVTMLRTDIILSRGKLNFAPGQTEKSGSACAMSATHLLSDKQSLTSKFTDGLTHIHPAIGSCRVKGAVWMPRPVGDARMVPRSAKDFAKCPQPRLRASCGQLESETSIDRSNDARKFNRLAQLSSLKSFRFDRPLR